MIKLMQAFPSGAECARSRALRYAVRPLPWTCTAIHATAIKWNMRIC